MVQQAVHTLVHRVVVRHNERRVHNMTPDWAHALHPTCSDEHLCNAGHMHHEAFTKKTLHERNWRLPCGGQESLPQERAAARCDHVSERTRLDFDTSRHVFKPTKAFQADSAHSVCIFLFISFCADTDMLQ